VTDTPRGVLVFRVVEVEEWRTEHGLPNRRLQWAMNQHRYAFRR
jgi:hypothetical protein